MKTILTAIITCAILAIAGSAVAQTGATANAGPDKTIDTGESTTFDGSSSTGSIASYNWDFGDGSTSSGATVTKTFSSAGTYTVTLVVVATSGATSVDTAVATVRSADTTAPGITHTAISTGTSNSAITINANVTDNIGVQSATLFYKRATDSAYNSTSMSCSGTAMSKTCSGAIPASVTDGAGATYYIRARDTKTPTPNTATYPTGAPSSTLSITLTDTAAPVITTTPPTEATSGLTLALTGSVTDNVGVSSVTLNYRFASSGTFTQATMTRNSGTATSGDYTASVSVPASATTVHYYLEAVDASANTARAPTTAPTTPTILGVASGDAPTITHTAITSGTAGTDVVVRATVSPASGRNIASVVLNYRAVGASAFTSLAMTNATTATVYEATLPGASVTDAGAEYYIAATDSAAQVKNNPALGASGARGITTPPAAPALSSATRVANGVDLAWTAPATSATDSVASFTIYRSADGAAYGALATVASSIVTYSDTSATAGVPYAYKVTAKDDASTEGTASNIVAASQLGVLPTLGAVSLTAGDAGITASWSTVSSASWYVVAYSLDNTTFTDSQNVTAGGASVSGLTNGVVYTVRVTPYNAFNEVGTASSASATPAAPVSTGSTGNTGSTTTTTPVPLSVSIKSPATGVTVDGAVTLTGTAAGDALTSVNVRVGLDAAKAATGTTSWTFTWDPTGLPDGTYVLTATATDGTNTASDTLTVNLARASDGTGTGDDAVVDPGKDDGKVTDDVIDDATGDTTDDDSTTNTGGDDASTDTRGNADDATTTTTDDPATQLGDGDSAGSTAGTEGEKTVDDKGWFGIPGFTGVLGALVLVGVALLRRRT